jgi:hypothetical protein
VICGRNLYKQGENEIRDTKRQDKEKKRKEEKGERERAIKKLPHHIIKKLTMNTQERKKTVLELDGRGGGTLFSSPSPSPSPFPSCKYVRRKEVL